MQLFEQILSMIMTGIYGVVQNYGVAIILFTLASKVILLLLSLWTYFNSITMLRIQPDINDGGKFFVAAGRIVTEANGQM